MELASMLAGERFGDHPPGVCPVLRGFLGTYNDVIDDRRRQDLYRYAAEVLETDSSEEVTAARARRAREWGSAVFAGRRGLLGWLARRPPVVLPAEDPDAAGAYAAYAACGDDADAHARALLFVDELIAMGDDASTHLLPLRFDVADVVPAPELIERPAISAAG